MNQIDPKAELSFDAKVRMLFSTYLKVLAQEHDLLESKDDFHYHSNSITTHSNGIGSYSSMVTEHTRKKICTAFIDFYADGRVTIMVFKGNTDEVVANEELVLSKLNKKLVRKAIKQKVDESQIMLTRISGDPSQIYKR